MRGLVIVPAFNEAANLPGVLSAIRLSNPTWDIVVVDDGSSDTSAQVAGKMGAVVLRSVLNLGIGGAVQTGFLWAREREYDLAVQIDGDGQHDPQFIPALVAPISAGELDLVIGSRFLEPGGFRSTMLRRLGIRYLSWFLRLRCGARVSDPTSGFRASGRRAIEFFAEYYATDYPEPESIALAARSGLKVGEVPVQMKERFTGRSSINAWRTLYYLTKVSLALILLPPGRGELMLNREDSP